MRRLKDAIAARVPVWAFDVVLAVVTGVVAEVELRNHADDGTRAGSIALNTPLVLLPAIPWPCGVPGPAPRCS